MPLKLTLLFLSALYVCVHSYADECVLTFESAWSRILSFAPSLAVADEEIAMREAEKRQVSFRPNPIIGVEAENLGVRNKNDQAEPPQTTFVVSQLVELGKKRRARVEFAASQSEIAYIETQIARQDLLYELKNNFIKTRIAQERLKIEIERAKVAEKIVEAVRMQVIAGIVSPIQEKKAELGWKSAQVGVNEASSELIQSRTQLSSMWGSACPDFEEVEFDLFTYCTPPSACTVLQNIENTFDFAKAEQEVFAATRSLKLQKANGVPDVNINFGYRIFNNSNQHGWVIGAEMPIPINRNQGNIQRAVSEVNQTRYQLDEIARVLREKVLVVYARLVASFEQSEMIRDGVLAEASETFNLTERGYNMGKLQYLDLLDSQRMLFESQEKYLEVLSVYHLSKAELNRLSGVCGL